MTDAGSSPRPLGDDVDEFMGDPTRWATPYAFFHRLQDADPVYYDGMRAWLVTRYADVQAVLRSQAVSSMRGSPGLRALMASASDSSSRLFPRMEALSMLNRDPPDHTRLRRLVSKAFSPRMVNAFRPEIQRVADELLDRVAAEGRMELVSDFAYPFPLVVISALIGVPAEDRERIAAWAADLAERFGVNPRRTRETRRRGDAAMAGICAYFGELAELRRGAPTDDLLSALVSVSDGGDVLSIDELVAQCVLLLNAGHETTANLIANAVVALLGHPDQLAALQADLPALLPVAVEELLRYDSSIQLTPRMALEDLTLGQQVIKKGQRLFLMLGAANRDERVFADPDRVELDRGDVSHVSFGAGIHYCIGAGLARAEIEIALGTLLGRFPGLELPSGMLSWRDSLTLRGPTAVDLVW
jgi:cytochrome P450